MADEPDVADEQFLLDLLNTRVLIDGVEHDELAGRASATAWLAGHDQPTPRGTLPALLQAREALDAIVRGQASPTSLRPLLRDVRYEPVVDGDGIGWRLHRPPSSAAALRAVLAWQHLRRHAPERLRPCANDECRRFLIDRSKANTARWCSMATCGNRMKARRHYERARG